jgi:hypothetical protein
MPLWATLVILGVVTGTGGFLLKYIIEIAGLLGEIKQQLKALEQWRLDHEAEHVAMRNNYWERPRWSIH